MFSQPIISTSFRLALTEVIAGSVLGLTANAWTPQQEPPPPGVREAQPAPSEKKTISERSLHPKTATDLTASVPENTIQLYKDANFKDNSTAIERVTSQTPGGSHTLSDGLNDDMSSVRWNLPPGVIVLLFEDSGAKGEQLALWGRGEIKHAGQFDLNDKATSWAWYYAGGDAMASEDLRRGAEVRPPTTDTASATVGANTIELFRDKNFQGGAVPIHDVTAKPSSHLETLPNEISDHMSSVRWNLPPGVVVVFYQNSDGDKQQAAVWGKGEVKDVDAWDFADKVSRWAWYDIGIPVDGTVAPARKTESGSTPIESKAYGDSVDVIARALEANKLGITAKDLVARKNPTGEGMFVYVPRTSFEGTTRHVIWMVIDGRGYAVTGPAKMATPTLPTPAEAESAVWTRTGIDKTHAEDDAVKVVFKHE